MLEQRSSLRYSCLNNVHSTGTAMFKTLVTLFRGRGFHAEETGSNADALTLLDQQIRDFAAALAQARKAAALAASEQRAERRRLATLEAEIAGLEARACAALSRDRDDLALETAGLLADLEADRDASRRACALYEGEFAKMRARLRRFESRIAELQRGRALARAKDSLGRLRRDAKSDHPLRAGFAEAEATLARLIDRNLLARDAEAARAELDGEGRPKKSAEKVAEAGCGLRLRPTSEDVFARLRAKIAA